MLSEPWAAFVEPRALSLSLCRVPAASRATLPIRATKDRAPASAARLQRPPPVPHHAAVLVSRPGARPPLAPGRRHRRRPRLLRPRASDEQQRPPQGTDAEEHEVAAARGFGERATRLGDGELAAIRGGTKGGGAVHGYLINVRLTRIQRYIETRTECE